MESSISVYLPDGSEKSISPSASGSDLAAEISAGLAREAIGLEVNHELVDLNTPLKEGDQVRIITRRDPQSFEFLRHTAAHILAAAVQNLYPEAKIAIGPTIQDGFYYDFGGITLSSEDLERIEAEMQRMIDADYLIKRVQISSPKEKIDFFYAQGEKYKAELLSQFQDQNPTEYQLQDPITSEVIWSDLCRGPHLPSTKLVKAFKLLSVSSAYWRGDQSNDSLQRVYGTAWWSKKDQDDYLQRLAELEQRDHRKLSNQFNLFSTHDEAGPGLIFWHPRLGFMRSRIEQFWRELHEDNGYQFIYTPHIARSELWQISGHEEYYAENMFRLKPIDEQEYVLKPMNCPFHVLIFNDTRHSYRELPIRYAEMGTVYRFEKSGVMHGLARVRGFTQDDAHIFCTPTQLVDEVCDIINLIDQVYSRFELKYTAELSTRPDSRIGEDKIWDMAEDALVQALKRANLTYEVNAGDGAFYGPKIDFKLSDALGRIWQGATIQLDFNLPERFDLKFTNSEGKSERPVMLHRAIFGSLERFTALLIENYAGVFPIWLCETHVAILPIADRHNDYAGEIQKRLKQKRLRTMVDKRSEKVNAKIRDAQIAQTPYMVVVGDKEVENKTVAVRERREGDLGSMSLTDFENLVLNQL
ncbi:MAG: threonine--tRNA ligase [Candidatus Caenarcaniphilales bacterium]|nr:threonine--tRNA ligase [Candidatus Caenarcaniphilales bacterium]